MIIQLQHDKRLAYASIKDLPSLSQSCLEFAAQQQIPIITFRKSEQQKPTLVRKKINATCRFLDLPQGDLIFYGIESDSPLAPLILWDAAHRLAIGNTITFYEDCEQASYLERDYFKKAFCVVERHAEKVTLRKTAPLLAELDAGLNRWSFCIPTGPGDPTGLNVIVKRILELNIPEKEIILCGRPDKEFLYFDQVSIVGEDIPAPPVWITRKKNVLAQAARYENLCILHDRVFLPKSFLQVIENFGDYYPFIGFQSLWFDDRLNLSPVRYSDYGCAAEEHYATIKMLNKDGDVSLYNQKLFSEIEKQDFKFANPLRYHPACYLTGSLYIVKRQVWLETPQNENLYWAEYEDIEHAERCELQGIPHRLISGAFTQTLFARPILYSAGYSSFFNKNGVVTLVRKNLPLPTSLHKPLIKLSKIEAQKRFARFSRKYEHATSNKHINEKNFITKIFSVIHSSRIPFRESAIKTFIDDIERDVLCDQMSFLRKHYLVNEFFIHRASAKVTLTRYFLELSLQLSIRPLKKRFYQSILEYFPKRSWLIKCTSFISAIRLNRLNGNLFYHAKGLIGYYKDILNSTPFIEYVEKKK